jgi:hypothetical protein
MQEAEERCSELEEEKATLEGMVESRDELLMEIAREIGLDCVGEGEDDEEEEEDADGGRDATAPPVAAPPRPAPPATAPKEIDEEGPEEVIPEQEAPVLHEVVLADAKPDVTQLCLYHALLRNNEEHPLRMEDDFDDLDDDPDEGRSDVDERFPKDESNDRD